MENKSVEESEPEIIRRFSEAPQEIEGASLMNEIKAERSKEQTRHLQKSMLDPNHPRMPSMQQLSEVILKSDFLRRSSKNFASRLDRPIMPSDLKKVGLHKEIQFLQTLFDTANIPQLFKNNPQLRRFIATKKRYNSTQPIHASSLLIEKKQDKPKRDSFLPNVKRPPRPGSLDIDTGFKKLRGSVKDSEQRLLRIKNGKSLFQEEQSLRPTDESGQSRSQIPLLVKDDLQQDYGKLLRAESSIRSLKEMSAPHRIFGSFTPSPGHKELSMEQQQLAQIPTNKLKELRRDQKTFTNNFSLPLNPALVTPTPANKEKVLSVDQYCRRKNLGFSPQQQILFKIKDSQNTHKRWSSLVTNLVPQSTELTPLEQMQRLETTREEIHKRAHKHSRLTPISTSQKSGYITPIKQRSPKRNPKQKEYLPSATAQGRFYSHRAKRDTEPSIPIQHFSQKVQPRIVISDMVLSRLSQTPETQDRVEEESDEEDRESAMMGGISMRVYEKLKSRVFSTIPVERANESYDRPHKKKRMKSVGAANVLLGIYKQTNAIVKSKRDNDEKLEKMLKRVELDRPIILKDKIDIMWSREDAAGKTKKISGSTQLRTKLIMKRTERTSRIQDQRHSYVRMLKWLHYRYLDSRMLPDEDERRICQAIRVVLDAGWVMTAQDLSEIYRLVNVREERVDPEHPARSSKMILFQEELRNLFNFD